MEPLFPRDHMAWLDLESSLDTVSYFMYQDFHRTTLLKSGLLTTPEELCAVATEKLVSCIWSFASRVPKLLPDLVLGMRQ